jgi:[acyl-carrier-protein] S-malonyltransferase
MKERGVRTLVECGPGRVLGGLGKRIDKSMDVTALGTLAGLHDALGGGE